MTESTKQQISRDMTISEIFTRFPQKSSRLAQEMTNAGLACAGCSAATWETLEAGMLGHGMSDEAIDSLIAKLNAILNEEIDASTVTVTERAAERYREILKAEGKEGWGLRFMEKAAGCNGYEFVLDFSEKATDDDVIIQSQGLDLHINRKSLDRLLGSQIDWVDGLQGAGFKVSNPNVKSSCSCGTSHGY